MTCSGTSVSIGAAFKAVPRYCAHYLAAPGDVAAYGPLGARGSDAAPLVWSNTVKDCPSKGVKLGVVCVSEAQISRILIVVGVVEGRRIRCLRRSDTRRRQHHGRCEDSGDLASHIVLHCLPALWSGRMGPDLHPSTVKLCGIDAFGIAENTKGLFGCAKQSSRRSGS
jgi:hypothetical protein